MRAILTASMQLQSGSAVVSTAAVGVQPTRRQQSPWGTNRRVESVAASVRRDAEQSDRDGRAPLFRLYPNRATARFCISSGVNYSLRVAMVHLWPNGARMLSALIMLFCTCICDIRSSEPGRCDQ